MSPLVMPLCVRRRERPLPVRLAERLAVALLLATAANAGVAPVPVAYGPPAAVRFETELITDTAGYTQRGGTGRSSWGFNQSNIVRHGDHVYAMCWRDHRHLVVFRRVTPGQWEASPPLPQVPQNGVLLVDSKGRPHVIGGEGASYHAVFDPPGQVQAFSVQKPAQADTRFGAGINEDDDIFVAGGLPAMSQHISGPSMLEDPRGRLRGRLDFSTKCRQSLPTKFPHSHPKLTLSNGAGIA